jgi:hypothetical protein
VLLATQTEAIGVFSQTPKCPLDNSPNLFLDLFYVLFVRWQRHPATLDRLANLMIDMLRTKSARKFFDESGSSGSI